MAATHASRPCTQEEQEEAWNIGENSLRILDVPGFGEADLHENRVDFILDHLPSSHVGLLVVGAPDRAWEHERQFVETLRTVDPAFPLLVVGNRIDMFNPLREWNPATLNLSTPHTAKEKNICEWAAALQTACGVDSEHMVLTSAGESFADVQGRYGLDILAQRVVDTLPAAVQNVAARAMRVDVDKRRLAEKIIWGASVAAAGVALVPIPFADALPLGGIQVGMIIKIADIYGKVLTPQTAVTLLSPVAATFVGRMALQNLLKFLPIIGTFTGAAIGAAIAGPMTFAIGKTYLEFFAREKFQPSKDEVIDLLKREYTEAQKNAKTMEEEARKEREAKHGGVA